MKGIGETPTKLKKPEFYILILLNYQMPVKLTQYNFKTIKKEMRLLMKAIALVTT